MQSPHFDVLIIPGSIRETERKFRAIAAGYKPRSKTHKKSNTFWRKNGSSQ